MSKVEELRETIVACVADSKAILSRQVAEQFVADLIAAARQEGAEQMKDAIRKGAHFTFDQSGRGTWHVDISLLAPAKEEGVEQDNTMEEEYEDMRRNGGPGVKP